MRCLRATQSSRLKPEGNRLGTREDGGLVINADRQQESPILPASSRMENGGFEQTHHPPYCQTPTTQTEASVPASNKETPKTWDGSLWGGFEGVRNGSM
jgi:hypothetical protein